MHLSSEVREVTTFNTPPKKGTRITWLTSTGTLFVRSLSSALYYWIRTPLPTTPTSDWLTYASMLSARVCYTAGMSGQEDQNRRLRIMTAAQQSCAGQNSQTYSSSTTLSVHHAVEARNCWSGSGVSVGWERRGFHGSPTIQRSFGGCKRCPEEGVHYEVPSVSLFKEHEHMARCA